MSDSMIATALQGFFVSEPQTVQLGPLARRLEAGSVLYPNDIVSLGIVRRNLGRRPIVWAITAGRSHAGLSQYVVQRGMGFHLQPAPPDTTDPRLDLRRLAGAPLDVPTTERLLYETYRYAGLAEESAEGLDPTSASAASSLALPFVQLVYAHHGRDEERMRRALDWAVQLSPNPELREALIQFAASDPDSLTVGE
jgi:hypothetical protein